MHVRISIILGVAVWAMKKTTIELETVTPLTPALDTAATRGQSACQTAACVFKATLTSAHNTYVVGGVCI